MKPRLHVVHPPIPLRRGWVLGRSRCLFGLLAALCLLPFAWLAPEQAKKNAALRDESPADASQSYLQEQLHATDCQDK